MSQRCFSSESVYIIRAPPSADGCAALFVRRCYESLTVIPSDLCRTSSAEFRPSDVVVVFVDDDVLNRRWSRAGLSPVSCCRVVLADGKVKVRNYTPRHPCVDLTFRTEVIAKVTTELLSLVESTRGYDLVRVESIESGRNVLDVL